MSNIYVREIVMSTSNRSVTVKVLKLWNGTDAKKNPISIEGILIDTEVGVIDVIFLQILFGILNFYTYLISFILVGFPNWTVCKETSEIGRAHV